MIAQPTNKTAQSTATRQRGQIIRSTAVGLLKLGFSWEQVSYLIRRKREREAKRKAVQQ